MLMKCLIIYASAQSLRKHGSHIWEIDVFEGDNTGLIVAEIELSEEKETFQLPEWAGKEVSADPRYLNASLVTQPYCNWDTE